MDLVGGILAHLGAKLREQSAKAKENPKEHLMGLISLLSLQMQSIREHKGASCAFEEMGAFEKIVTSRWLIQSIKDSVKGLQEDLESGVEELEKLTERRATASSLRPL